VVIDNLHIVGIPVAPDKTDAPLIVDANTVLPFSVAFKRCQVISRGRDKVTKRQALRHVSAKSGERPDPSHDP